MRHLRAGLMMSLLIFGIGLLTAAEQGKDNPRSKAIQGSWTAAKDGMKAVLIFRDNEFTFIKSPSESFTGTFTIGVDKAGKMPDQINMTVTGGEGKLIDKYKGKISLGIIKIGADKLEWCANEPGNLERPTMFGQKGVLCITFERDKK